MYEATPPTRAREREAVWYGGRTLARFGKTKHNYSCILKEAHPSDR